jgi:hypothetical protein
MTIHSTVPRRLAFALACATLALAARPADAQLRKLKDLGKAAVKGAVEGPAEGAAKKAAGAGEGGSPAKPGTVQFTANLLEITDARIAQFIKGFDAEIAARPAADRQHAEATAAYEAAVKAHEANLAKYDRDQAAYEKRSAAYQACADKVNDKYEKASRGDIAASEKAKEKVEGEMTEDREKRLEALGERMRAPSPTRRCARCRAS